MGDKTEKMKKLGLMLFGVLMIVGLFSGCSASHSALRGKDAPSTRFTQLRDASLVGLDEFKGKTVVLGFWSTTCRSSAPNMRRLARYAEQFHDDPRVAFLSISLDKNENIEQVKSRIRYDGLDSLQSMFSGNEEYDEAYISFKGERLPYFVVIDRHGRVVEADNDDGFIYDVVTPENPFPRAKTSP